MRASSPSGRAGRSPPPPPPRCSAIRAWAREPSPNRPWISLRTSASIQTATSPTRSSNSMVIYLPGQNVDEEPLLDELTPREIVRELDKHVVGQADAKRAVAIALRNRIRRQKLPPEMAEEVMPKNILMIGPTGVGKTELARRLAKLSNSPFMKVEASKFTEVGYVGRDVESMIRDLVEISIDMVRNEKLEEVADKAEANAEERVLDLLMPPQPEATESLDRTREKLRERLREGKLDERIVELEVKDRAPTFEITTNAGIEEMGINLKDMLPNLFGQKS